MRPRGADLTIAPVKCALSIAGSDPTGGAGLQADLQVFRHFGVHGAGVPSALTVQDTHKVHSVLPVFPSVVLDQLRAVLDDLEVGAVKLGMLASDDVVRSVSLGLDRLPEGVPIVIDPVLHASDGTPLLERRAMGAFKALCARAALLTPNIPEAETLVGGSAQTRSGCEAAARACIEELGAGAVLLKGGHRSGAPDDLLARRDATGEVVLEWLPGERIEGTSVHGTGCALAAATTAALSLGHPLEEAVDAARRFVVHGIANAQAIGGGSAVLGFAGAADAKPSRSRTNG